MIEKKLKSNLKKIRKFRGVSKKELEEIANCSVRDYNKFEKNIYCMNLYQIIRISCILDVPFYQLFDISEVEIEQLEGLRNYLDQEIKRRDCLIKQ